MSGGDLASVQSATAAAVATASAAAATAAAAAAAAADAEARRLPRADNSESDRGSPPSLEVLLRNHAFDWEAGRTESRGCENAEGQQNGLVSLPTEFPSLSREKLFGTGVEGCTQRPLLIVSSPKPVGSILGRYCVTIQRASLKQPFGISFNTDAGSVITIAEDLPHLGLQQFDELVKVNGCELKSVTECQRLLLQSSSLQLVLQHREEPQGARSQTKKKDDAIAASATVWPLSHWWTCAEDDEDRKTALDLVDQLPAVDQSEKLPVCQDFREIHGCGDVSFLPATQETRTVLLSMSGPFSTNESSGEFMIEIQRSSLKQKFGIMFATDWQEGTANPMINIAEDMPQFGLRNGDVLLGVNGISNPGGAECRRILERSTKVLLKLKRVNQDVPVEAPLLDPCGEYHIDEHEDPRIQARVRERPNCSPFPKLGCQPQ